MLWNYVIIGWSSQCREWCQIVGVCWSNNECTFPTIFPLEAFPKVACVLRAACDHHMRQFTGDNYSPSFTYWYCLNQTFMVARNKDPLKTKFTVREEESPGNSRAGAMVLWSCMEAGTGRLTSTAGICGASFAVSQLQPEQLLLNPPPTGKFSPHFLPLTQLLNSDLVNSDWEWVTLVWKMTT